MNRFFVHPAVVKTSEVELSDEIAHQLSRVLRLTPGDHILLLDGLGMEYEVELTAFERIGKQEKVKGKLTSQQASQGEPNLKLTLYQALLKGEKFDYVLQKGTEIGISSFVPIITERCITTNAKLDRWQKIVREAAEQAHRGIIPSVTSPLTLSQAFEQAKDRTAFLAWEAEKSYSLRNLAVDAREISLFVGPEGGFSEREAEQARLAGILTITLGKRILRAETAGLVAATIAFYQTEDI